MSWLDSYLAFTRRQESPTIFHWWNAITTVAATLNRKCFMRRVSDGIERYRIYPGQIMVVLVAGSGRLRKSTSLRLPSTLLRTLNVRVLDGATSPEKLLSMLGGIGQHTKTGVLTILAPELSVFLSRQNYAAHLVTVLNDLADAPDRKEFPTIGRGDVWVRDACVTLFGATTPIDLAEAIPPSALQRGFSSRIIFVFASTTDRKESLSETKVDPLKQQAADKMRASLVEGLARFATLTGEFDFTPEGKAWYDTWYSKHYDTMSDDAESEGWPARRQDHLLRVAMVLSVCHKQQLLVDVDSLQEADAALREVESGLPEAFARVGVNSGNASGIDRIISVFKKAGGRIDSFTLAERCVRYYPDFQSLNKVIFSMQQLKWIRKLSFDPVTGMQWFELVPPHERTNGSSPPRAPVQNSHHTLNNVQPKP